jgi:hypothetical protein
MTTTEPRRLRLTSAGLRIMLFVAALSRATPEAPAGSLNLPPPNYSQSTVGTATANLGGTPTPYAEATASNDGATLLADASSATAFVTYYFGVAGPAGVPIPLQITSFVEVDIKGAVQTGPPANRPDYSAGAAVFLVNPQGGTVPGGPVLNSLDSDSGGGPNGTPSGPLAGSVTNDSAISALSDTVYQIDVQAGVSFFGPYFPGGSAFALADPVISFAPGFDSTGFTLEFSPGIGNQSPSAVPEPSTLVMPSMLFGMFGVLWAYRQLQRTRAAGCYPD